MYLILRLSRPLWKGQGKGRGQCDETRKVEIWGPLGYYFTKFLLARVLMSGNGGLVGVLTVVAKDEYWYFATILRVH